MTRSYSRTPGVQSQQSHLHVESSPSENSTEGKKTTTTTTMNTDEDNHLPDSSSFTAVGTFCSITLEQLMFVKKKKKKINQCIVVRKTKQNKTLQFDKKKTKNKHME